MLFEAVSLTVLVFLIIKASQRPRNFPPGPKGIPFFGYLPFLSNGEPVYRTMKKLAKTYGPVAGFYVGPNQPFISVVGPQAVKEALHNDDLNGRPSNSVIIARTFGEKLGVVFTDGEFWREQRRFTMRQLREMGFGKTSVEYQMTDEIRDLIDEIKKQGRSNDDFIVDFKGIFVVSVVNILWAIVGGERFQRDDARFKRLLEDIDLFFRVGNPVRANFPVPVFLLRLFPGLRSYFGVQTDMFEPLQKFIKETVEQHEKSRSLDADVPRDFIDAYLDEVKQQSAKNPSTTFTYKQLVATVQDLITGGSETTANSIGFTLLYLINYPQVQHKMQEELDQVCGTALPSLALRASLPYTDAVLMEVQRMNTIAPLTAPHRATKDTKLLGYNIPKGSILSINIDSVLNDADTWKDPHCFRPERHLNVDMTKIVKNENHIPFGVGKRMCLGEPLTRNSYFLFTSALVKTFDFSAIPGQPLPTLEPVVGFTSAYDGFKAVAKPRSGIPTF
ncbi:hypothetical protein DAPPUDRAFT_47355 [Daphnia pulex]|uniref:Cytochrome P450 n=1 Tax=Daphnia pulex TaxID=6669 RepID=E9G8E8_DAPPU|nr:hypothetical protein DAPPUDRAFT_47355 [Daphnia pulex]|eukprot:EFX83962.1 hypothetical protein DAPPUDRAFT_47355 [Daphnia pulex]